jgi:hypothetical protein
LVRTDARAAVNGGGSMIRDIIGVAALFVIALGLPVLAYGFGI